MEIIAPLIVMTILGLIIRYSIVSEKVEQQARLESLRISQKDHPRLRIGIFRDAVYFIRTVGNHDGYVLPKRQHSDSYPDVRVYGKFDGYIETYITLQDGPIHSWEVVSGREAIVKYIGFKTELQAREALERADHYFNNGNIKML